MKNISFLNRDYLFTSVWTAIFLAGLFLFVLSCYCGIGLTYDSKVYLQIAGDFYQKDIIGGLSSDFLAAKPPLFPFMLSVFLGADFRLVFFGFYVIILLLSYLLIDKIIINRWTKMITWALISIATPILLVHNFLWSEPLFMIFLLLIQYVLIRYMDNSRISDSIFLVILFVLLLVTRHVGLFVILGIAVAIVITRRKPVIHFIVPLFFGFLVFVLWNYKESQGFMERLTQYTNQIYILDFELFFTNYKGLLFTISRWFIPTDSILINCLILFGFLTLIGYLVKSKTDCLNFKRYLSFNLILFAVYIILLGSVFLIPPSSYERYLTPFYPIFIIGVMSIVENFSEKLKKRFRVAVWIVLTCWITITSIRGVKNVIFWNNNKCGGDIEIYEKTATIKGLP